MVRTALRASLRIRVRIRALVQNRDPLALYGAVNSGTVDLYAPAAARERPCSTVREKEGSTLVSVRLQEGRQRLPTRHARQHVRHCRFHAPVRSTRSHFSMLSCSTERSALPRALSPKRFYAMQTVSGIQARRSRRRTHQTRAVMLWYAATEARDGKGAPVDPRASTAPLLYGRRGTPTRAQSAGRG